MKLLDGFSRARAIRLAGALAAAVSVAACAVGVSSAAAGVIRAIPVGHSPEGISAHGGDVWVSNAFEDTVSEIEASSGGVIRTVAVGNRPTGVSSDGTHVWVSNAYGSSVNEIEPSSGAVIRTIPVGTHPNAVSSDGTHVWVTDQFGTTIDEIDASSGTVIRTITVGSGPDGVSSDGTHVWVTNEGDDTVSEIDAASGAVIRTIPVGSAPEGVSSDGTHVWVANAGANTVSEIVTSSGAVINTISVGSDPRGMSSDGTHAWVANFNEDTVSEIAASSGEVISTIAVGHQPMVVSSDGAHAWAGNYGEDTVNEIPSSNPPAPKASIESPAGGGNYLQGEVVTTKFSCTEREGGPGLESCTDSNGGSGTSGVLETSTVGLHTYMVTARSKDEALGTAWITYRVIPPTSCTGNTGKVTLSPGLTNTPAIQTMKVTGELTGCVGKPFTKVKYAATLTTTEPVSCSALTGAGEPATGPTKYTWRPKAGAKASTGPLNMLLTETPEVAFAAEVTAGSYSPLRFAGTATEVYTGGATCGEAGRKPAKPVKKGTFSGSFTP